MSRTMSAISLSLILSTLAIAQPASEKPSPARPPNLVLVMADDCTWSDMEVYGGQAKTPTLKRLAKEGMTFSRCFQSAPMCSPTRHALYTGLHPVKSGAWPNHTRAYGWVKSVAHYVKTAGYRAHLSGKRHIAPARVFPFEYSGNRNPDPDAMSAFVGECVSAKTPFLLIAASREPHSPWNKGDASAYPQGKLKLPPVLVDTPKTRERFSAYLAEVTYFDSQVGEVLALLEKHGVADDTLVIVLSEQGNSFPFAKWTCYDAGLRSGFIARWKGKVTPGSKSDALVEYVDVVPTFLEAAGVVRPQVLDGKSFLPVLTGAKKDHKRYAFGLQTSRGINNGPESYGIRSVRGPRYRYVRNLTPNIPFQNALTRARNPIWSTWVSKAESGDERAKKLVHDFQHRVAEELYDCENDPWNRTNLIDRADLTPILKTLRGELDGWMKSQGDEGQPTEMKSLDRQTRQRRARRNRR